MSVYPKSAPVLSEAEQRLRTVVAKAPVFFFALDSSGIFTLSEGRALEKLGLRPGQVVGQSVFQLYRQYPKILESARRALAGEEFTSTGALPDVDLCFETHWAPIRSPEGKLAGTIGIAVDISDRMRNERGRQEAEILYRNLVEQLSAVTYIAELGLEGDWRFVSPQIESLLGYTPEEWLSDSANWIRHVHPEDHHIVSAAEDATLAGSSFRAEYRVFRHDGRML